MLKEFLKEYRIILASQSPRRKMLIEGLDIDFKVLVKDDIEEVFPEHLGKKEIPVFLAEQKSDAYAEMLTEKTLVITADTIVWHNNRVLGKPENREHAVQILAELSDSMHEVVTGVCIRKLNQKITFSSLSKVWFRSLTEKEINYYLDHYQPYDKAGSYGIQEWIGYVAIEKIEGSFYNVMGLPVQALYSELLKIAMK